MTVRLEGTSPSPSDAARVLGVSVAALDVEFGLVAIDPAKSLYCVMVGEEFLPKVRSGGDIGGPYANPRIDTFGPPKSR